MRWTNIAPNNCRHYHGIDFNANRAGGWRLDLDDDEDAAAATTEELAEGDASDDPEL